MFQFAECSGITDFRWIFPSHRRMDLMHPFQPHFGVYVSHPFHSNKENKSVMKTPHCFTNNSNAMSKARFDIVAYKTAHLLLWYVRCVQFTFVSIYKMMKFHIYGYDMLASPIKLKRKNQQSQNCSRWVMRSLQWHCVNAMKIQFTLSIVESIIY